MKKIFILFFAILLISNQAMAVNFGMYKPEEDYGLIDGFRFNFGKKARAENNNKLIQVKTDIPEEQERMAKEKAKYEAEKDKRVDDEYQMYQFMLDDTVAF